MEEASGEETTVTAHTRTEGRRAAVLGCRNDGGPRAVRLRGCLFKNRGAVEYKGARLWFQHSGGGARALGQPVLHENPS